MQVFGYVLSTAKYSGADLLIHLSAAFILEQSSDFWVIQTVRRCTRGVQPPKLTRPGLQS